MKLFDQLENLRLHGDIERGGRLVGDEQLRLGDERHGNHHALPHAAGEFVRVAADALGRAGHADIFERLDGALHGSRAIQFVVEQERLDELLLDAQVGIERRHRVLKDHRDALAADGAELLLRARQQIDAVEQRTATFDASRRLRDEAHERVARHRFTRAALADDSERLAFLHRERNVLHRAHNAVARVEAGSEVLDVEQWHESILRRLGIERVTQSVAEEVQREQRD